jgi:hypothetical protein
MALNAKKVKSTSGGKSHPPLDAGTYPARVVQVIGLGMQKQKPFKGQEKPDAYEIMLTYEFVDEFLLDEDGNEDKEKPRWYSETFPLFNLKNDKARSTKRYYALDPEEKCEGDFSQLVGTPCMVTLSHNPRPGDPNNPYVNVSNVSTMRPKEAAKAPELVNPSKVFDPDEPDVEILKSLPEWLQEKICSNVNFEGSALEKALASYGGGKAEPEKEKKKKEKPALEPEEVEEAGDLDDEIPW